MSLYIDPDDEPGWGAADTLSKTYTVGGDDWSLDNGEIYWDGTTNNEGIYCLRVVEEVFAYRLESKNCLFEHVEISCVILDECYLDDWTDSIVVARSPSFEDNIKEEETPNSYLCNEFPEGIVIHPNPTSGQLYLIIPELDSILNIKMFDHAGNLVFITHENQNDIDITFASSGLYILEIKTNFGLFREKIIKI